MASWPLSLVLSFIIGTIAFVAVIAVVLWLKRSWRRHHPPPSGMAEILKGSRTTAPVLLVTDSDVLFMETKMTGSFHPSRIRPTGVAHPIPGLLAVEGEGELLVVSFADGSKAALRQRSPDRNAGEVAAKVATLAATALSQRTRIRRPSCPSALLLA